MGKFSGALLASAGALATLLLGFAPASANDSVIKGGQDPNEWAVYGKDYANTRYSPLKAINTTNVGHLRLAYAFQLASLRSNESTPLVIGDTLYVSTSWGPKYVYAIDAATGARKWTYEPDMPDDTLQYACCDVDSRGVAYADGKIFVGRLDGKLVALDAKTGKELWKTEVVDYTQGSVITSPPLVVKNLVITGFGGGEYGVRGALQAYDINTGKQVWKTWTVPVEGRAERRHLEGRFRPARRRRAVAGRLLRSQDQHRLLGHQQSRPVELRRPFDRQRRLRQADQPLHRLNHRASTPTPARSSGGCRRPPPTRGTMTASMKTCSPTLRWAERPFQR